MTASLWGKQSLRFCERLPSASETERTRPESLRGDSGAVGLYDIDGLPEGKPLAAMMNTLEFIFDGYNMPTALGQ